MPVDPAKRNEGPDRPIATSRGCPGFDWLASRDAHCDRCRLSPWQHDHVIAMGDQGDVAHPWPPTVIHGWADNGTVDTNRARHLLAARPFDAFDIRPVTLRSYR